MVSCRWAIALVSFDYSMLYLYKLMFIVLFELPRNISVFYQVSYNLD